MKIEITLTFIKLGRTKYYGDTKHLRNLIEKHIKEGKEEKITIPRTTKKGRENRNK